MKTKQTFNLSLMPRVRSIKNWSLGAKLSIAMLLIVLPAVLGSAYYNLRGSLHSVNETEVRNLELLAESIASQLRQTIASQRQLAAYVSSQPTMLKALQAPQSQAFLDEVRGQFNSVVTTHEDVELLTLLNESGDVLTSSDPDLIGRNFGFREYFREAVQGRSYTTNIIVGAVGGNSGVFYSYPVKNPQGSVIGVMSLKVRGYSLGNLVEKAVRTTDLTPYVIDHDGVIIYHPEKQYRYKSLMPLSDETQKKIAQDKRFRIDRVQPLNQAELSAAALRATSIGHVRYLSALSGDREIAGFAPVGNHSWTVIVAEDEAVFSTPLQKLFRRVCMSMAIVALVVIVLLLLITRMLMRPLQALAHAARSIERGNYETVHIQETSSADEIGLLSRAFKGMLRGILEREKVKDVFGRMVSPELREKLLKGNLMLGGETARVSVLFSDIRDFSSLTEGMTAQEVVVMLNEYLTEMSMAIRNWDGYINNFIGDSLVVVFGAPIAQQDIESRAVFAALEMRQRLDSLNRRRTGLGLEELRTGIGISTGEVVAGQMGSLDRFLYTVIGDAVNVATSLEALTKDFPEFPILVNSTTQQNIKNIMGVEMQDLGEQPIRGRLQTVRVWGIRPT
jgi:adenylate cyclase